MGRISRLLRIQIFVILLVVCALPGIVQAALMCRADPVVILSNGMILDIGATISTLPWQVEEVHYELHIPVGVRMITAIHTPTWLTSQETFTVVANQSPNQYRVYTTVHTSEGDASVVADTTLVSALKINLGRFTVSGFEGQRLALGFRG